MTVVRVSIAGNTFDLMSERDKEIFNLGMNLMGMGEDHPHYASELERLEKMMKEDEDEL